MYYDLLVKIKNAERARKKSIRTSFSNMDIEVARILVEAGYLKAAKKKTVDKKNFLEVELNAKRNGATVSDFKIVSKPGRRVYVDYRSLRPVRQGYGTGVVSTPKGIKTISDARKQKVGGEYLFQIW